MKSAVWQLGEDRAPGPNGFLILFFKRLWDLVKKDLIDFIKEFFDGGIISKDLGALFITLPLC